MNKKLIVIFVEGDTEEPFFKLLMNLYKKINPNIPSYKIINLKGVGRYSKIEGKLKNEILPKAKIKNQTLETFFCSFDTDVFERSTKPPINWNDINNLAKRLGLSYKKINIEHMIEDWFLNDIEGICSFLAIESTVKIEGENGNEKLKKLYRKRNKIYKKGSDSSNLVAKLDIEKIRNCRKVELSKLEKELGIKIKEGQKRTKRK